MAIKSTSYGSVLGALVNILNDKISTSFKININRHNNIEISTFIFLKARLPFVQSEVFCTLYICSGVAKGYRGEDKALEMDRKVEGRAFGVHRKEEAWKPDKHNKINKHKNKQNKKKEKKKRLQITC